MIQCQTAGQYHKELCKVILALLTCMAKRLGLSYGTRWESTLKDRRETCSEVRWTTISKCRVFLITYA